MVAPPELSPLTVTVTPVGPVRVMGSVVLLKTKVGGQRDGSWRW